MRISGFLILYLTSLTLLPREGGAQNRAGLVVRHGDGTMVTVCVPFEEESISGYELLQRSGLEYQAQDLGFGVLICSIDSEGCPSSHCWCQCSNPNACNYWSYWQLSEDGTEWRYASGGAQARRLTDGKVDGWVWGLGTEPPEWISFERICDPPPAPINTHWMLY